MNDSLLDLEAHPSHCLFMLYRWWKAVEGWRVTVFVNDLLVCNNIFTRPARLSPRSTSCLGWSWTTAGCPPKERQRTVNYNSNIGTGETHLMLVQFPTQRKTVTLSPNSDCHSAFACEKSQANSFYLFKLFMASKWEKQQKEKEKKGMFSG